MQSDRMLKMMNGAHRLLIRVTRGRIGHTADAMPVLELTTTGRRSGERRSVLLTAPATENGGLVVVASRGGDDRHPAWFLNLRADPSVLVALRGAAPVPMRARVLGADERARLWPQIIAQHRQYGGYQKRTDREIPLVVLEPVG